MRLTDAENRLVAKLRKGQRVWRSSRWVVLGVCVAGAVQTVSALFSLTDLGPEQLNLTKLAFIACFSPPVWVFLSVCSVGIGYTIGRWKGDAKTILLLRMLEDHEKEAASKRANDEES